MFEFAYIDTGRTGHNSLSRAWVKTDDPRHPFVCVWTNKKRGDFPLTTVHFPTS